MPGDSRPMLPANGVVAAPCSVAMRSTWAGEGCGASMPGSRWARSTSRISCSMSRSSLMPASSMPMATGMPCARKRLTGAMPLLSRKLELQLWQIRVPVCGAELDVVLGHPDAVADGELRAEQAERVEIGQRRAAGALLRIGLLVGRLQHMHVDRQPVRRASSAARLERRRRTASAGWRARPGCGRADRSP